MLANPVSSQTKIDFNWAEKLIDALETLAKASGGQVCTVEGPKGSLEAVITFTTFEQCCLVNGNVVVQELLKVQGTLAMIQLGKVACSIVIAGVPGVATLNLDFEAGASIAFGINAQEQCSSAQLCGTATIGATVAGGVSGQIGPGGLVGSLKAKFQVTGVNGTGNICYDSGTSSFMGDAQVCAGKGEIIGSFTLLGTLFEEQISYEVFKGWCSPKVTT